MRGIRRYHAAFCVNLHSILGPEKRVGMLFGREAFLVERIRRCTHCRVRVFPCPVRSGHDDIAAQHGSCEGSCKKDLRLSGRGTKYTREHNRGLVADGGGSTGYCTDRARIHTSRAQRAVQPKLPPSIPHFWETHVYGRIILGA
eukprot:PhF_6_TR29440/c0_g1_i2/m.43615